MKYVIRNVQGISLKVPMRDANTPIYVVAIHGALAEKRSVESATGAAWAASRKEIKMAKTANGGARIIVVGMAHKEIKGSFVVDSAWVEPGIKLEAQRKPHDRLFFSFKEQLLGRYAITLNGEACAPRRAIALCH